MNKLYPTYLVRVVFTVLFAFGIAFVYPVHVIVDHSGLVDKHFHHSDDGDQSSAPDSEDDLCLFCLTMNFMEVSGGQKLIYEEDKETNYAPNNAIPAKTAIILMPARVPPISFDCSSTIQILKHQKDLL